MLDLYFNPEYAKLYEKIDGKSDTFYFDCEYGKVQNTFILREIPYNIDGITYYDIVTPYGYGGPVITECSDIEKLTSMYHKAFTEYCIKNNIVCEFIRFHLIDNVDFRENYYGEAVRLNKNVAIRTTGDIDTIWMSYEQKVRKNVKKALRNDLAIMIEPNSDHLDEFLKIYYDTMDRNDANSYYYFDKEYFLDIEKKLPGNFIYFYVLKDNSVISTELVLCSEKYAYSFLGGTNPDFYDFRPNDFLKHEVVKWCNETGRELFILGGGYHEDDGIYRYKKCYSKDDDIPFYCGKYIFNQEIYDKLVQMRKADKADFDENSSYFPLFRA